MFTPTFVDQRCRHDPAVRILNFLLVGQQRSGMGIVQTAVSNHPQAVCHGALMEGPVQRRREMHETYFGPCPTANEQNPAHFVDVISNPVQYVTHSVFDHPLHGEMVIGMRMSYPLLRQLDFFEHVEELCLIGDFCVVHIVRNPVCCYTSLRQAEDSGLWRRPASSSDQPSIPYPVRIDQAELTNFVRESIATQVKLGRACDDALVVSYRDLCLGYDRAMCRIMRFLELGGAYVPQPDCRRLRNLDMRSRVSNWEALRREVPSDVRDLMREEELY